jgi:hypothetical protein
VSCGHDLKSRGGDGRHPLIALGGEGRRQAVALPFDSSDWWGDFQMSQLGLRILLSSSGRRGDKKGQSIYCGSRGGETMLVIRLLGDDGDYF